MTDKYNAEPMQNAISYGIDYLKDEFELILDADIETKIRLAMEHCATHFVLEMSYPNNSGGISLGREVAIGELDRRTQKIKDLEQKLEELKRKIESQTSIVKEPKKKWWQK
tara:strand:+ start:6144 stop:6476 length:333 start_codon:yes stop_codon:yes gene_type:complete